MFSFFRNKSSNRMLKHDIIIYYIKDFKDTEYTRVVTHKDNTQLTIGSDIIIKKNVMSSYVIEKDRLMSSLLSETSTCFRSIQDFEDVYDIKVKHKITFNEYQINDLVGRLRGTKI